MSIKWWSNANNKSWWCFLYNWLVSCQHPRSSGVSGLWMLWEREKRKHWAHNHNNTSPNNQISSLTLVFPWVGVHCPLSQVLINFWNNKICFEGRNLYTLYLGEPQDELVHDFPVGPGHGVLGDAVPRQELPQNPHLQAGAQDQAPELHGQTRYRQGLHGNHCRLCS